MSTWRIKISDRREFREVGLTSGNAFSTKAFTDSKGAPKSLYN